MTLSKAARLAALTSVMSSPAAWTHPGHQHSAEPVARLLHSVTEWGPLLVVLVIAGAGAYRLWKSSRH